MQCSRKHPVVLVGAGGFILVISLITLIAFPSLYSRQLQRETSLVDNSILFNIWKDSPFPIYQRLYFFNVTNERFFIHIGDELNVKEVGPYTYKSKWVKEEFTWDNGTVTYQEVKTYVFDRENSVGPEEDSIYTLNGPLIIAAEYARKSESNTYLVNYLFEQMHLSVIVKKTIGELAFSAYYDPLLEYGNIFPLNISYHQDATFSWLYKKNGTDDGVFSVGTGEKSHQDLNVIKKFNGEPLLDFWSSDSCNMINGTNGELGPPLPINQTSYSFFQPFFCRTMTFQYAETRTVYDIQSMRFENTADILANADENPDNYCFETDTTLPSGAIDLRSCRYGSPIILSFPHFYLGDEKYFDKLEGLHPIAEKHKSFIDIDPLSGMTVNMTMRYQLNVDLQTYNISVLKDVTAGVYPVFWVEIQTEISKDFKKKLDKQLENPKVVAYPVLGALVAVSAGLLLSGLILMRVQKNRVWKEKKPLLNKDNKDTTYATITPASEGSGTFRNNAINTALTADSASKRKSVDILGEVSNVKSDKISKTEALCVEKNSTVPSHKNVRNTVK